MRKGRKALSSFEGDSVKDKKQKEDNFLLYIPKRKEIAWEEKDGKVYLVFQHEKVAEKFMRWLVKKPYISDLELDNLGSSTWKLIDGNNSVFGIGQRLLKEYGSKCEPVYDRLILYLRYLNKKGWISFDRGNQE